MKAINQEASSTSPWLWVALLVTVLLTLWTVLQDDAVDEGSLVGQASTQKATKRSTKSVNSAQLAQKNSLIQWDKLVREPNNKPKDLFSAANWSAKRQLKQRAAVKVAPPPPQAPPVPFTYMGRLDDGPNGDVVYLVDQEQSYSVGMGNTIGPFWRLDSEDENSLHFTYLPLSLTQTLAKN